MVRGLGFIALLGEPVIRWKKRPHGGGVEPQLNRGFFNGLKLKEALLVTVFLHVPVPK